MTNLPQPPLLTPITQRFASYTPWVWAPPPSLAATRRISFDFFSSQVLRWFTSLCMPHTHYLLHVLCYKFFTCKVTPFGYLRIIVCLPLPVAFRSLPRPSSPYSSLRHPPWTLIHLTIFFILHSVRLPIFPGNRLVNVC